MGLDPADSERFWGKVRRTPGCWPWTDKVHKSGYGQFWLGGVARWAHTVAYEDHFGVRVETLDHLCHTRDTSCPGGPACTHRRCCNPAHLEPVTTKENTLRGRGITAEEARSDRCGAGHSFDERNTRWQYRQGVRRRICRLCEAQKARARRAVKKMRY